MPLSTIFIAAEGGINPLGHVVDKGLGGGLTLHTVTLIVASILTVLVMMYVAKRYQNEGAEGADRYIPKGVFAQMIETICIFIREQVARPQLGAATDRFIPYLWTLFFFILFNNVLGLIPLLDLQHLIGGVAFNDSHWAVVGGTATGNIAVTGALALIAFVIIQVNGIREAGIGGWLKHLTGGAPAMIAPIMIPVELMGMFIKPGALAVRLFANMVAGHTLLATIMLFTGMGFAGLGIVFGLPIWGLSFVAAIAIYFLEIFVAFLQAFVFMFLTIIFIAQFMHHHHDEHEGAHDYDHDQVPTRRDEAVPVST
ncbi:MAG: F0F1 ATP synthase subunit A [Planctomycetota bacterium]|nr:F0F1 ATP synthase subunit A [Planctomycetota bacterium]